MNAELRIDFHEDMHMVGHDLHFDDVRLKVLCNILEDSFEPDIYSIHQDRPPILRAPYHMVFAGIDDVVVGLVVRHTLSIHPGGVYARKKIAHPMPKGRGLRSWLVKKNLCLEVLGTLLYPIPGENTMFRPLQIFDGPILAPQQFVYATETFAKQSCFRFHAYDVDGKDLYPDLPISVEHGESYMLVYVIGLIKPNTPGQHAILQGMARVRGYLDLVHVAFEPLREDPLSLNYRERIAALNNIKRRLRHSIVILANRAGLTPFDPSQEDDNAEVVSRLSDSAS